MTLPFFFVVVVVVDEKGRTTDCVVVVRARASSLKFVAPSKVRVSGNKQKSI